MEKMEIIIPQRLARKVPRLPEHRAGRSFRMKGQDMKIEQNKIKCLRCGHEWVPRIEDVRVCLSCHSPKFDVPKEIKDAKNGTI